MHTYTHTHAHIHTHTHAHSHVIVINRRQGLYWFYKREARGRVVPEAERLLNQYRPMVLVNKKYFLDHAVT